MASNSLPPHTRPLRPPSSRSAVITATNKQIHWLSLDDSDDIKMATTVPEPEPEPDEAGPLSPVLNPINLLASSSRIVPAAKKKYIHCTSLFYHDLSNEEGAVDEDEGYSTATAAPSPAESFVSSSTTHTSADDTTSSSVPQHKRVLPSDHDAFSAYLLALHDRGVAEKEARRFGDATAPTAVEERVRRLEAVRREAEVEGARMMREASERALGMRDEGLGLTVRSLEDESDEAGGPGDRRGYDDDDEEVHTVEDDVALAQTLSPTDAMDLDLDVNVDEAKTETEQAMPEAKPSIDGQPAAQKSVRDISGTAYARVSNPSDSVAGGRPALQLDEHELDIDVGAKRLYKIVKQNARAEGAQRARWVAGYGAGDNRDGDGDEVEVESQSRRTTGGKGLWASSAAARGDEDEDDVEDQPRRTTGGKGLGFSRATITAAAVGSGAALNPPGGLEMLKQRRREQRGEVDENESGGDGDDKDDGEDGDEEVPAPRRPLQAAPRQKAPHSTFTDGTTPYEMAKRHQRDLSALEEAIRATAALVAATGTYTTIMESEIEELRAFADVMLGKGQHASVLPPRIREIRANMRRRDKRYLGRGKGEGEGKEADMRKIAGGWWEELKAEIKKANLELERLRSLKYGVRGMKNESGRDRSWEDQRWKYRKAGRTPASQDRTPTATRVGIPPPKTSQSPQEDLLDNEHESPQESRPLIARLMGPCEAQAAGDLLNEPEDVEIVASDSSDSDNESVISSASSSEAPTTRYTVKARFTNMDAFNFTTGEEYSFDVILGSSGRKADQCAEEFARKWGVMYSARFAAGRELDSETHISKRDGMVVRVVEMGDAGWKVWVEAEELLVDEAESESDDETGSVPQRVYAVHSQRRITRNGATLSDPPSVEVEEDPFSVRQFTSPTHANDDAMGLMVWWYGERFEAGYVKMAEREMEEGLSRESLLRWEAEVGRGAEREEMRVFVIEKMSVEVDDDE